MKKLILFILTTIFINGLMYSQVTTGSLSGNVFNNQGVIEGASVTIESKDIGFNIEVKTDKNGAFILSNLSVGVPYKVTVSNGTLSQTQENIFLQLGQLNVLSFEITSNNEKELQAVEISAQKNKLFDTKKMGTSTNIDKTLFANMPSISRSADDFTRLTPSASPTYNGMSFAGRNGQYNNLSLDGAIFNNPFGLDAPGPGGQAGAQPISLDAIEQIQINIAPYDVTQSGFTGAGVNTVTKSGTNSTKGTAFAYYRNDAMTGKSVDGKSIDVPALSQFQVGATLGGAIKKDKLFYFLSFETEQRSDAGTNYKPWDGVSPIEGSTSRVLESDLIKVKQILKDTFNYDAGAYKNFTHYQKNYKWLGKLTWNINKHNRLDFVYNGLAADKDKPAHPSAIGSRGPDRNTLQFQNSGYTIRTAVHNFNLELNSFQPGVFANKFKIVYTIFDEKRLPFSAPAPVINITKNGERYIIAGHEPFSINNSLFQNTVQITNNFTFYVNKHTLTAGASFELFRFDNSFNLTGYGLQIFDQIDIESFKSNPSAWATFGFDRAKDQFNIAKVKNNGGKWDQTKLNIAQVSAYIQDEFKPTPQLTLTLGLRMDMPLYLSSSFTKVDYNADGTYKSETTGNRTIANNDNIILYDENGKKIINGVGKDLDNTKMPSSTPLFSPRFGFNYDIKGDKTMQLRGGSGLFTGRFPFVWIANHLQNPYSSYYNATASNFQWPQVWRSNIGFDVKLPSKTTFIVDVLYTKDVNGMMVRNYGLGTPTRKLVSNTGDNREYYDTLPSNKGNTAYVFTNTNVGQSFNTSVQVQQVFPYDIYFMAGYNYLYATDASSISAEISGDAFDRNPTVQNPNKANETISLYGNTHRFITTINKKFEYGTDKNMSTQFSLFGSLTSGNRFSYVYAGDANNDGANTNDLIYVPTDNEVDKMTFTVIKNTITNQDITVNEQKTALKKYINQDEYLASKKGGYVDKNGGQTPWFSQIDLRILQSFSFKANNKTQQFQLSLDIINLGNLLNSSWGVVKYASVASYYQPIGIATNTTTGEATYTFDPNKTSTFQINTDLFSRWQMQFGLRYIF